MAKRARLKGLRVDEVSLVRRGANQHADVLLYKSDDDPEGDDMSKMADRIKKALGLIVKDDVALQAQIDAALAEPDDAATAADAATKAQLDALTKRLEEAETALAYTKMSDEEKAFCDGMPEAERKGFMALSPADRAQRMKAKKSAEEGTMNDAVVKSIVDAAVTKALAPLVDANDKLTKANKELADTVAKMTGDAETAELVAVAKAAGATDPKALSEVLRPLTKEGRDVVLAQVKALRSQVDESALFGARGAQVVKAGSALETVTTKAAELRKADPKLTEAQAISKAVLADPDLYARYQAELS